MELFERNPDLVATEMNGETLMLDVESGKYFSLNGLGGYIWRIIAKPADIETIVTAVLEDFDGGEKPQVEQDVEKFLTNLVDYGLVKSRASTISG